MVRVRRNTHATGSRKASTSSGAALPVGDTRVDEFPRLSPIDWLIGGIIALAALAVYAVTWGFGFTNWDDGVYILSNPNLADAAGLWRIWFSAANEQYYPLTFTTFWLEHRLWGEHPTGYHVVNTVLHATNVLLVFLVTRRTGLTRFAATAVAALFALHPMQAMSVAWVAERKNLLSCLFLLLATWAWIAQRQTGRRSMYAFALLGFLLGLLSKSAIAPAPFAWLAMDLALLRRRLRTSLPAIAPMIGMSVAAVLVTAYFERGFLDAQATAMIPTVVHRLLLATTALWWYPAKLLAPTDLSPVYPLWQIAPARLDWWLGAAALLIVSAALFRMRHRLPPMFVWGLIWFVSFLAPVLGLAAYGNLAVTPTSNHYVYIPCIGLFAALAAVMDRWRLMRVARTRAITLFGGALLVAAAIQSRTQATVFRDSRSLWTTALAHDANCFPARLGLGTVATADGAYTEALDHYSAAVQLRPHQYEGHAGVGETYLRMGQWAPARASLDAALAIQPTHAPTLLHRAQAAAEDSDLNLALELARRADELCPTDARAPLQVGILSLRLAQREIIAGTSEQPSEATTAMSRIAEARQAFDRVIALRPDDAAGYRGAVECDRAARNWESAIRTARAGLAALPDNIPLKNLLASTLARCPDDRLRDGAEAVRLAEELRPALRGNFQLMETLASAYGAVDRFDDAALVSREAAKIARQSGSEAAARANEAWAADYEQRKPRLD